MEQPISSKVRCSILALMMLATSCALPLGYAIAMCALFIFYPPPERGDTERDIVERFGAPYIDSRLQKEIEPHQGTYLLVFASPNGRRYGVEFDKQGIAISVAVDSR